MLLLLLGAYILKAHSQVLFHVLFIMAHEIIHMLRRWEPKSRWGRHFAAYPWVSTRIKQDLLCLPKTVIRTVVTLGADRKAGLRGNTDRFPFSSVWSEP